MKRYIFGTRASYLFSCVLVMTLIRFAFPAAGLADVGKEAQDRAGDFYFGEGFRGNLAMIGEAAEPPWPAWLTERDLPVSGQKFDLPFRYPQGPEVDQIQRFVHKSMQSVFVACGIYAAMGGIGSKHANQLDDATEQVIWKGIKHMAKTKDEAKPRR